MGTQSPNRLDSCSVTPHLWSIEEIVNLLLVEAPKKRGPYKKKTA
jgi:hypothetical protein